MAKGPEKWFQQAQYDLRTAEAMFEAKKFVYEMAQKRASDIVQFFKGCLKEKGIKVSKIVVFGSQARGTATEESDIDLVIVSEDFKGKNIFKRANLTKDAEIRTIKKFMVPLDIITLTPEEYENRTSLAAEYAREGEIVYAG
jgi:predicted nucleotidyltransferase